TIIELSGLLLVLLVGMGYWGSIDYLDATTAQNPTGDITYSLILGGAVLTFYSFIGFEDILNVSEEVKDPKRNVPRGLILAVIISSLIYMAISITAVSVIPAAELAGSKEPLVDVVRKAAPWFPPILFSFIAMFAVANTALLNFVMGSRLIYGMSTQGLLPKFLSDVHAVRRTPYKAVIVVLIILLALALSGDVSALAKATSVLLLFSFFIVNIALLVLQQRKGEPKGNFEIPAFVPALGSIVCLAMLSFAKQAELTIASGLISIIFLLYFVLRPQAQAVEKLES
ncbi:MAG: APC family permease, partial [Pseudobdellovibrionaceae bacterium]